MAIEHPSSEPTTSQSKPIEAAPARRLRRRLRVQLERHLTLTTHAPTLTVVGFVNNTAHVLSRGRGRPEDAILGLSLPVPYSAIGVLASSVVATPPQRRHTDGALALAVSRSDEVIALLATSKGVLDTREPQGWLIDACRRAVGLSTAPCAAVPLEFALVVWLDRLMLSIVRSSASHPLRWSDAVELCPTPKRWRSSDPIELGATLASTLRSWPAMRRSASRGLGSPVDIEPHWAAWMDDTMFARWCMGFFPDLGDLRADVEFLASPTVAENLELTIRAAWLAAVE